MFDLIVNAERMEDEVPANLLGMAVASRLDAFVTGIHVVAVYPPVAAMPEAMDSLPTSSIARISRSRRSCSSPYSVRLPPTRSPAGSSPSRT